MEKLTLHNSKIALESLDKSWEIFENAITLNTLSDVNANRYLDMVEVTEEFVRKCFWLDTSDRNSFNNCSMVDVGWIRRMTLKY